MIIYIVDGAQLSACTGIGSLTTIYYLICSDAVHCTLIDKLAT